MSRFDDDFDIEKPRDLGAMDPPPSPRYGLWAVVAALFVGAGIALYVLFRPPSFEPASVEMAPVAAPAGAEALQRPEADLIELPELDASDEFIRQLVRTLSIHPGLASWMVTPDLVRVFVRTVEDVANGVTPRRHVPFLSPETPFQAAGSGARVRANPTSYSRYDLAAAVAGSIDPAGAARLYVTIEPLVDEAAADLGYGPGDFNRTLERAFQRLLATPVVDEEIELRPHGGVAWQFTDARLEALSPVQKQLIGMGPRNQRIVQNKLREIARELGLGI